MRIAFIEPAGKGGMIHYAFQLCRGLSANGADVTLITERNYELASLRHDFRVETSIDLWDPKPSGRISTAWHRVAWRKLRRVARSFRYYREWLRVIRRISEIDPDVVLLGDIRFASDLVPLFLLSRRARLLADICHNVRPFAAGGKAGGLFDRSRFRRFFYRRIYRLFDLVFVHFDRNREEFIRTFGIPSERVPVIVHGNEQIFDELRSSTVSAGTLRQRLGVGDAPIVLFFGTLSRYKGVDVLLNAFPHVHRTTGAHLVLAGFPFHDFDVAEHQARTRALGVQGAVTWVAEYIQSDEIAAWMELASVIVFPYRDIYQSGALHVAQTFGVPIVASAVGAIQDVIKEGVSGLLVPSENPDALGAAIVRLLSDRELASRLGSRAAQEARCAFSWQTISKTIVATCSARLESDRRSLDD